ncbi:hypothetical protein ROHU_023693 [Labeo rohita]|uniref:Uncharacterized protein n=1 Tax=Labeo rohita TaxID=84645 RepID=A0A498MM19_LABRO|nr:hypothetical protein ROHU_023693 [Labeo rohita]
MKKLLERTVIPQGLQMGTMLKPSSLSTNEELLQMQNASPPAAQVLRACPLSPFTKSPQHRDRQQRSIERTGTKCLPAHIQLAIDTETIHHQCVERTQFPAGVGAPVKLSSVQMQV